MDLWAGVRGVVGGIGVAGATLLVGCAGDGTTAPVAARSCGGGGRIDLAPLRGTTVSCAGGTMVTLTGSGASYLVVAELAASGVPADPVPYSLGMDGPSARGSVTARAASASIGGADAPWPRGAGVTGPVPEPSAAAGGIPGMRQLALDGMLRDRDRARVAAGAWRSRPAAGLVPVLGGEATTAPEVGSVREFHVLATASAPERYAPVGARLDYAGANVLLYVDTAALGALSGTDAAALGDWFDRVLYPLDVETFGPPSDIDGNGRLIMVLTPVVNALTPAPRCGLEGYVAGFFTGNDLVSSGSTSNRGEVFYALVPDPAGRWSCPHPAAAVRTMLGGTFLHETQHLISFSQHVLIHGGPADPGWLDEGLSLVAEELGARYYAARYPPPAGRSTPAQLFPDSAAPFIRDLITASYAYLLRSDSTTLTLHADADPGSAWRGGDWLLLRWLGDRAGGPAFYRALEASRLVGVEDLEAAAGAPFPALFGEFGLALYTDSLPGLSRSELPAGATFGSPALRALYQDFFDHAGGDVVAPYPFPIRPQRLMGSVTTAMVPGTMAYYRVDAPAADSTVTLRFGAPGGAALASKLGPQLAIFRLPAP